MVCYAIHTDGFRSPPHNTSVVSLPAHLLGRAGSVGRDISRHYHGVRPNLSSATRCGLVSAVLRCVLCCVVLCCAGASLFGVLLCCVVGFVASSRVSVFAAPFMLVMCGALLRHAVWLCAASCGRALCVVLCCAGLAGSRVAVRRGVVSHAVCVVSCCRALLCGVVFSSVPCGAVVRCAVWCGGVPCCVVLFALCCHVRRCPLPSLLLPLFSCCVASCCVVPRSAVCLVLCRAVLVCWCRVVRCSAALWCLWCLVLWRVAVCRAVSFGVVWCGGALRCLVRRRAVLLCAVLCCVVSCVLSCCVAAFHVCVPVWRRGRLSCCLVWCVVWPCPPVVCRAVSCCAVLCCWLSVLCVARAVCVLWCPFPPCRHAKNHTVTKANETR